MKNKALFSLKDKIQKLKCRLLQFLFGALRFKRPAESLFNKDLILNNNQLICMLCQNVIKYTLLSYM